jgi:hypothetical protein
VVQHVLYIFGNYFNLENRMDNPEELATQGKDKQSKKYNTEN